jgi:hypothetical protein
VIDADGFQGLRHPQGAARAAGRNRGVAVEDAFTHDEPVALNPILVGNVD